MYVTTSESTGVKRAGELETREGASSVHRNVCRIFRLTKTGRYWEIAWFTSSHAMSTGFNTLDLEGADSTLISYWQKVMKD